MSRHLLTVLAAAALTLAIGLISGGEWSHFVMGAVFALSLWVMLLFGVAAKERTLARTVPWQTYAVAAAIVAGLGLVFNRTGEGSGAWWAPAVILVGIFVPMLPQLSSASRSPSTAGD